MPTKLINTILIILLLTPTLALAADPPANTNPLADPVLRLVITESLKTREDIKAAMDEKLKIAGEAMQAAVDDNFKILDQRLNDFAVKLAIKLGIIWFSTTFLAMLTTELLFRKIYQKAIKSKRFQEENQPQTHIDPQLEQKLNQVTRMYNELVLKNPTPVNEYINQLKPSQTPQYLPETPPPPPQPSAWQKWQAQQNENKKTKQTHKLQKALNKQALKAAKEAAIAQKIQEALQALQPPTPTTQPQEQPQEPKESIIDKTHQRIQQTYENQ